MQTLQQLVSGKLKGITHLKLLCHLQSFPQEIIELADTLEILDLSGNELSELPENFDDLKKLKIAFFSDNHFTKFPKILSKCANLTMIGFKSNKITIIPENAFPKNLQWLILTNNCISTLPESIGNCTQLQKVALAGNNLISLPKKMANCKKLELLRISANQLSEFPEWLFSLPRLSWLAYSGNPCSKSTIHNELPKIKWKDLIIYEELGTGASGIISKAEWNDSSNLKVVAVKVFKGEVTSDGFPDDEMNACIEAGNHQHLVKVLGKIEGHPAQKSGLVMELIPPSYKNLGGSPSFDTCTRDTFKEGVTFTISNIFTIATSIASTAKHLHLKGIMHGDLYAHNTLINENAHIIFGDFGAATIYNTSDKYAPYMERLDVRAFGCLLEDLLNLSPVNDSYNKEIKKQLFILKEECMQTEILKRPSFTDILMFLNSIDSTFII